MLDDEGQRAVDLSSISLAFGYGSQFDRLEKPSDVLHSSEIDVGEQDSLDGSSEGGVNEAERKEEGESRAVVVM